MAMKMVIFFVLALVLQRALGDIVCEDLSIGICSYSISSSGTRCLLETSTSDDSGTLSYQCKTSDVTVNDIPEWVESDACVSACGVDRFSVGISSDAFLEPHFTAKLCGPACYQNCPNIVDLYYNLAIAEGVFLPSLCKVELMNPRRAMSQLLSSGASTQTYADGPASVQTYAAGPGSSDMAWAPSYM